MKTLCTVRSPYNLNERTKFMNKGSPTGKLFPPPPRYGKRNIDTRTWSKIRYHDLLADIETLFNFLKQYSFKYRNNECRELLDRFKKENLNH